MKKKDEEEEEKEGGDFLARSRNAAAREGGDGGVPAEDGGAADADAVRYDPRKPAWWRRRSGRRGTRAQRRAVAAMGGTHLIVIPRRHRPPPPRGRFLLDWDHVFGDVPCEAVWLELGFGRGDNLLRLAEQCPEIGFVGADPHGGAVGTVCRRMQTAREHRTYWRDYTLLCDSATPHRPSVENDKTAAAVIAGDGHDHREESTGCCRTGNPYDNVRLYGGDGVTLLRCIPTGSLAAILVTFPDPFPGKKECRLIQEGTVRDMRRCLRPTGRLYLATDHGGFFEWSKSILDRCSSEYVAVEPCPDRREWLPVVSKYEQKGWDEGRSTITACWEAV